MNDQKTQTQGALAAQTKQVVVFHLDNDEYAVPIEEVKEVVSIFTITHVPNSPEFILGVINLRGKILPVVDLETRFHLKRENKMTQENIIIFEDQKKGLFGVCVDKVTEVLKVALDVIKPTPEIIASKISSEFLKGVIVLTVQKDANANTTDRILLLLDLPKILEQSILDKVQTKVDDKSMEASAPKQSEGAIV